MWKRLAAFWRERGCARWAVTAVALGLGACLGVCLLTGLALAFHSPSGGPLRLGRYGSGLGVDLCAGAVMQPRLRVGVGWVSPILSSMPPEVTRSPYAVCVSTSNWPSGWRLRGEYLFPP